ncbi:hypothetical protein PAEPH01_1351 [Pancytospora epiphaga]|nr:hypothetical protein PAEPH01_1351 [Pancytospora epiphaga]
MIESNIIKRFIVKTFTQYNHGTLNDIAGIVMSTVKSRFFINESVCILSSGKVGKITRCNKDIYSVTLPDGEEIKEIFNNIQRCHSVFYDDVIYFLECITRQTTFGLILIENVNEKIEQKTLSGQTKLRNTKGIIGRSTIHDIGLAVRRSAGVRERGDRQRADVGPLSEDTIQGKMAFGEEKDMDKRYRATDDGHYSTYKNRGASSSEWRQEELDTSKLAKITVFGFEDESVKKLVKIYMLLRNFQEDFKLENFDLELLANTINDPDYSSQLAFNIHSVLISIIEGEIKSRKERYYESISFIIDSLPPFTSNLSLPATKKRAAMNQDNWKHQTKLFIQQLCKESDNEKVLQFTAFSKKDSLEIRLGFLVFLVDIVVLTEHFRELVSAKQANFRATKGRYEELGLMRKKKLEEGEINRNEILEEIKECNRAMISHPLRVHLGNYNDHTTFVMDDVPVLMEKSDFYLLDKKDISLIICNLKLASKVDKNLALNLKICAEVLL